MVQLPIIRYPDRVLRSKAEEVKKNTPQIQKFINDMIQTMYKAHGVGLASPQVNVSLRIIVLDTQNGPFVMMNPTIVEKSGTLYAEEGCLSIPGFFFKIRRAQKVRVKGLNRKGEEITIEADGLIARIFQHEIDHIDGKLIIDRIGFFKRFRVLPTINKRAREGWPENKTISFS